MATGNSVHDEIREQQKKAFATMSLKEKLAYFWDYYKIHTLIVICAIIFVVSFVHQIGDNKPYAFYAVLINALNGLDSNDTNAMWENEFLDYAGIDSEAYRVCIDTSITQSSDGGSQYEMANRQKMAAMLHAGDIDVIIADTESFEDYAHAGYFHDLSEFFIDKELAPYADFLYYTDAAAFDEETANTLTEMEAAERAFYAKVIDHSDPSGMEKPIPVGIRIPASGNKLADAGYYRYLQDGEHKFQGYPMETVIGVPLSAEDPTLVLEFLLFLDIN